MRRLDRPVPAIEGEEAFRGCGFRGQAGDTVGCLAAALAGLDLPGFAADSEDLSDAGEVEVVVEPTGDPDGAPFATAVLGLRTLVHEVRRAPGDGLIEQEADVVMQGRLVALDGEQIVCAAAKQVLGQRPLGEQRIGGDGAVCDVGQRLEQGDDGADLVGALLPFAGVRPHADFF